MEVKSGFVVVFANGERVYEGYVLNGEKFITVAPVLNMSWYDGLLSEEEWESLRLGNPNRYAYERFGEAYLNHMREFTKRVLEEVKRRFNEEDLKVEFVAMPEDYVREILGLPVEEVKVSEDPQGVRAEQIKRILMTLGYTSYYINGEGNRKLAPYTDLCESIRGKDTAFLLIYPKRLVLVGRVGDTSFVAITPGISTAIHTLLQLPSENAEDQVRGFPIERFKEVGVPVAKVVSLGGGRLRVSILRHVGLFVNVEKSVEIDYGKITELLNRYNEWLSEVEVHLKGNPPPHMTLPAWRKLVAAYLDDYPHPDDFRRVLSVLTYGEIRIPECKALIEVKGSS